MDKLKRIVLMQVPMTICNLQCHYCYLPKRNNYCRGKQIAYRYSPEHVAKALSKERLGGCAYINICAEGETLLATDIDKYIYALLQEGHYCEVVSNMTVSKVLKRICEWDASLLAHLEFKCSFHYLELKKRNLLELFAENVNKCWRAGASINIEVTPSDELIPYIEEVKKFSLEHFGALPHLTIARDDGTENIEKLTKLSEEEYINTWSTFDSDFWNFKMKIFGEKRKEFCYAGARSIDVDLANGNTAQCYCTKFCQNIFDDIQKPITYYPYGHCTLPHCFNGHSLLTLGCVPNFCDTTYAEVRDRVRMDGTHWLHKEYYDFISQKLDAENPVLPPYKEKINDELILAYRIKMKILHGIKKFGLK